MLKMSVSIAMLLGSVATPALADAPYADPGDIVVTASRIAQQPREIGSALTVVTAAQIKQGQIIFAKDVLQDLAGVQISSDRPGNATNVSIRGSDNDQVLWMIDGIRLGDPSQPSTQFASDSLTTSDIARIEVLRGNQSSLYGSDAIGGVVNIITQRATEDGIKLSAEGEGGSYGTVDGGASVLGKSGPVDFRLTVTGYSHDGPSLADPRTATSPITEDDRYWRYGLSGRIGVAATDTLSFRLVGFWQKSLTDLDNATSDSFDVQRKQEYALGAQANYRSTDGKLHANASLNRYQSNRRQYGSFALPDGNIFKGTRDTGTVDVGYDAGIWAVSAGGSWEQERTDQLNYDFGTGGATPFNARVETKSGYGEVALRPVENLTVTGAARIDDNSRFGSFGTYRGTVAYVIPDVAGADNVKLRASYGSGAKAPGLYQLFDPTYGNANLKVETSEGGDVGFDVNFAQFSAQFSYFFGKTKNEIFFDPFAGTFGGYGQFGRTRKSGVEAAFVLTPTAWLEVRQSFTYLDARTDTNEDGVYTRDPSRPRHSGSTSVTVTPIQRLSLTARTRYRSGTDTTALFGGVTQAFAVVDLLASYGITDKVEVYGRVTNLFDKAYQMTYGTQTLGTAAYGGIRVKY
ncbi:MAG TPA: TonB-dependent receptor [Sphingobium sp.]|uniref:TonB-dependent receptor n=1 Tax=Sphingobium sp. TaxID=1912891 RepID=UPI002ED6C041